MDFERREVGKFVNTFHLAVEESWLLHAPLDVILREQREWEGKIMFSVQLLGTLQFIIYFSLIHIHFVLLSPPYRWGNWCPLRLNNLPRDIKSKGTDSGSNQSVSDTKSHAPSTMPMAYLILWVKYRHFLIDSTKSPMFSGESPKF